MNAQERNEINQKLRSKIDRSFSVSKKWQYHFFEKKTLRFVPQLSANSGQFDTSCAQSAFPDVHAAGKSKS